MEEIKQMIADAAKEIIDGVDGISEGSAEYDNLMEQLIYIQTINYKNQNPDSELEVPDTPQPLKVGPVIRKAANQIDKNRATKEAVEELQEEEPLLDEEGEPLRN